jgi:hypothetical protein
MSRGQELRLSLKLQYRARISPVMTSARVTYRNPKCSEPWASGWRLWILRIRLGRQSRSRPHVVPGNDN